MRSVEILNHTRWECKYFASTVGRDEQVIREYIWRQEAEDRRIDQMQLM